MLVRFGVPPPQLSCAGSSWSVKVVTVLVARVGQGSGVWHQVQAEPDWKAIAVPPPRPVVWMSMETEGRPERSIDDGNVTPRSGIRSLARGPGGAGLEGDSGAAAKTGGLDVDGNRGPAGEINRRWERDAEPAAARCVHLQAEVAIRVEVTALD